MEQGLTLEQLQQMGVKQITPKPVQQPQEAGLSLEEMQRIGAKEIKPKVIPQFDVQGRKIDPVKYAKQQQTEQNINEGLGNVGTSLVGGTQEQFMGGLDKIKTSVLGGAERMQAGVDQGGVVGAAKFGRAALETGLGAASGAVQTLFSPVTSAIGTGIQGWMELDRATGGKVKDSVASLVRSNPELVSKFNKMIAYDPQLTTDVVDILNVLGTKTGVKASKPMVTGAVEATVPAVKNAVDTGIQVGKDFIEQRAVNQTEKIINARAEELRNISNNYVSLKKKQIYNKDFDESIKRVAETDVLVGAVDENGLISTKGKGGAVERYKAETLDGAEQVVRTNLERLNETVNLADVEKTLTNAVNKSGLEGADLKTALNSIRQEIAGYKLRADMNGNVPLTLIQDAKISKTKGINYLTPPNVGVKDKAIANGLKRIVEDNSILNVKEINNELSKYLKDIDFLESLDGKRVKGGKLGKYFAQISGNIIGGAAGAAIGGATGSAIGTIIGGELGSRIKGTLMSKTLKGKTGTLAPKNKIIEGAVLKAKEYKKMSDDLKSFYKTYGKETGTKNSIIKLDARNKEALNDFLNSIKEVTPEAPVVNVKELKSMYDAMYESGIEKYNALVKFQEGGAKNKFSDGLPEVLGKKAPGANGRNLAANSYAQKFQKQGDYFIEELGFKDRDEANDFLESFKDIIEQRKILKNYSNKEGSLNQQYNPTNNSNSIDIQPNTTPTPPKGKGIRGMIDFDEIMKSLIPTKKLVAEAKDAVDELESAISFAKVAKSPQAVVDLRKALAELMTSMGKETVITNSNYKKIIQEADDMVSMLKAHIKNSEAQASNDVIERRFIKNPTTGKLEGSSKKKVVSEDTTGVPVFRGQSHEGLTAFDGTNKQRFLSGMDGTSFSLSKESAKNYGDKIVEGIVPNNTILRRKDLSEELKNFIESKVEKLSYDDYVDGTGFENVVSELARIAKGRKKNAIDLTEFFPKSKIDDEIRVLNKDGVKVKSAPKVTPLEQEAKKYKSAEEFVKAQGELVYHGTDANFTEFSLKDFGKTDEGFLGKGVYLTSDKTNAEQYGANIVESFTNLKNPYTYDAPYMFGGFNPAKIARDLGLPENASPRQITDKLKSMGHDGVVVNEITDTGVIPKAEVVVFDPKNIKTKQQLTDIWNKANKK